MSYKYKRYGLHKNKIFFYCINISKFAINKEDKFDLIATSIKKAKAVIPSFSMLQLFCLKQYNYELFIYI